MSTDQPTPPSPGESRPTPSPTGPSSTGPGSTGRTAGDQAAATGRGTGKKGKKGKVAAADNPLRGSRTSGTWLAVLVLVVVLVLLAVFILQNTQKAEVSFFGWTGQAPLSATLLIAAAGGALLVAAAGALRILQLRRRIKREIKSR